MPPSKKRNVTLLIVEDDHMIVKALSLKFEGRYKVVEAFDGREGLRLALKDHPDLILLDLLMPNMDGITMLRKLRSDPWGKKVKVMILTNLSNEDMEKEARSLGVSSYIIKSDLQLNEVIKMIEENIFS